MHPSPAVPLHLPAAAPRRPENPRLLYTTFAGLLLVLTFLGFQFFYLRGQAYPGRPLMPETRAIVIAHGLLMSVWMLLMVAQPALIAAGRRRLHMALGKVGALIAAGIIVVGPLTAVAVVKHGPEFSLWGLNRHQFLAVPLLSIVAFAGFIGLGIAMRRRAEIHRPMMFLGTLAILAAATDRIAPVVGLYGDSVWGRLFGPFFPALVIGAVFLAVKTALTRRFDRPLGLGLAVLVLFEASVLRIATTDLWARFASWITG